MENGEANDRVSHTVHDLTEKDDINGDIITGSIIAIVGIFVIFIVAGIWWFYQKNFRNKGHSKIAHQDIDDEEDIDDDDGIEMNVTHCIIEETEELN